MTGVINCRTENQDTQADLDRRQPCRDVPKRTPAERGLIKKTIAEYRLKGILGRGNHAEVFVATRRGDDDRLVVFKWIPRPRNFAALEREVAALHVMNRCPLSLPLLDVGCHQRGVYLVFEHRDTLAIDKWLRRYGPATEAQVLQLIREIAALLRFASEYALYHLDLWASNVVYDGRNFYLIDWTNERQGGLIDIHVEFNKLYTAPEVYRGCRGVPAEVYSLGCVAYYFAAAGDINAMLDLTIESSRAEKIHAHLYRHPRSHPAIAPPLFALLERMLAKDPGLRPSLEELCRVDGSSLQNPSGRVAKSQPLPPEPLPGSTLENYRRMALDGIAHGEYKMGLFYEKGHHVTRDREAAIGWYRAAAGKGYAPAQTRLALLLRGDQTHVPAEAHDLLRCAAARGYPAACHHLAEIFDKRIVPLATTAGGGALHWWGEAARNGYRPALRALRDRGYELRLSAMEGQLFTQWCRHDTQPLGCAGVAPVANGAAKGKAPAGASAVRRAALLALAAGDEKEADRLLREAVVRYREERDFTSALAACNILLSVSDSSRCYNLLGLVLRDLDRSAESIAAFETALRINPRKLPVLYNLANTHLRAYRLDEAEALLRRILEIAPEAPVALRGIAECYREHHQWDSAIDYLRRSLAAAPDDPLTLNRLAHTLLLIGEYREGFALREARLEFHKNRIIPDRCRRPLWRGESLAGKSLLVYREQGIGDTIHYLRYLRLLKHRTDVRIVFRCNPQLTGLCSLMPEVDELLIRDRQIDSCRYDYHVSLLSLPALMGTTYDSVPSEVPYIPLPEIRPQLVAEDGSHLQIGIVWNGGVRSENSGRRDIDLDYFASLLDLPGARFYSLQVGPFASQLRDRSLDGKVVDLAPRLKSFTETAVAIDQLDLVISVDTAVAHMAGALGKEVWIPLQYTPDYRWGVEGERSIWYPSARLFRETRRGRDGEWEESFGRIRAALTDGSV